MAACKPADDDDDDDDDDGTDTATETPWKPIANNDFTSLYDTSDGTTYNPRVPKDWSFSGDYVDSSKKASDSSGTYTRYGTISVTDTNFNDNESKYKLDAIKKYNEKHKEDENFEEVKAPNPKTMQYDPALGDEYYKLNEENEVVEGRDDDKILMIAHLLDTATRYKSGSITVQPNAIVKITVRVYTAYFDPDTGTFGRFPHMDLSGNPTTSVTDNPTGKSLGATISLTGGVENPLTVTGIDTDNTWQEYTIYIRGDASSTKTVNLELGLGSGNPQDRAYYTNGYAFFDNIETEFLSQKDFSKLSLSDTVTKSLTGEVSNRILEDRIYRSYEDNETSKWEAGANNSAFYDFHFLDDLDKLTPADGTVASPVTQNSNDAIKFATVGLTADGSPFTGTVDSLYTEDYEKRPFEQGFYAFNNTATDGKLKNSDGLKFRLPTLVGENTYYRVSLWLKTTDFKSKSGANIYLFNENLEPGDTGYYTSLADLNTTTNELSEEDLDLEENPENSYYKLNGWRQYSFYIKGGATGGEKNLNLQVWFGPYTSDFGQPSIDTAVYPDTYDTTHKVMFTQPVIEEISSSYYSSASSGENISTIDLSVTSSTKISNGGFTAIQANAAGDSNEETKVIHPASWTFIGGLGEDGYNDAPSKRDEDYLSGVLNGKNFTDQVPDKELLNFNRVPGDTADNSVLYMNAIKKTAFGYRSSSITVPANSVYTVSVWGYTMAGTDAYIYLTDTDGKVVRAELEAYARDEDGEIIKNEDGTDKTHKVNDHETLENQLEKDSAWHEYFFVIRTGFEAKTFTMELWTGAKFLPEGETDFTKTYTTGKAMFDDTYVGGESKTAESGSTALTPDQEKENKRIDESFEEAKEANKNSAYHKYFDFKDLDLEEEEETPAPGDEEEPPAQSAFGWLDIVTLVLALALLFALGAVGVRQFKKSRLYKNRQLRRAANKAKHRSYDRRNAAPVKRRIRPDGTAEDEDDDLTQDGEEEAELELEGSEFDEDLEDNGESEETDLDENDPEEDRDK